MRKQPRPRILTFAILTTLTLTTWVAFEVVRTFTSPTPVSVGTTILEPFNPAIDTKTLESIRGRLYFPDDQARRGALPASPSPSPSQGGPTLPSPSPVPVPTGTEEGELTPSAVTPSPTPSPAGGGT